MTRALDEAVRVAVITGGANGIGRAFARRMAQDGLDVAICDLQRADGLVSEIEGLGQRAWAEPCDVTDPASVTAFASGVCERLGGCDVLVHNAGIYPAVAFLDLDWNTWRRVLSVNLDAVFHVAKAFVPGMVERGWGRVVTISSTAFHAGLGLNTHYNASKGGLIGFTRSLASEVGDFGVTVNSIAPGLTRTATTEAGMHEDLFTSIPLQQAIKRAGRPEDVSGVLSFLVSDDAAFVTGQTIAVDGGWVRI